MTDIDFFLFVFPALMSLLWTSGAIWQYLRREARQPRHQRPPDAFLVEPVSVLIPCFNEAQQVTDTVTHALSISQRTFEVIAIDDGSTDDTLAILKELERDHPSLRVLSLGSNQGKAAALRAGAKIAKFSILVCIDGDARIDRDAPGWLAGQFITNPKLGAATGNPRVRNRHSMLTRLQVGEFSAIVGTIKRAQMRLGCLFTVSGVIAAFRKIAVEQVDYWTADALTEDIDITWKIQRAGWRACFEPRALVWILTPATWSGLWRQRLRWAMGGAQVMLRNADVLVRSPHVGLRVLMLEMMASVAWCYLLAVVSIIALVNIMSALFMTGSLTLTVGNGAWILLVLCLLQFSVGTLMDHRYDPTAWRSVMLIPLYPAAFWVLQCATTLVAYPKILARRRGRPATWISPDRGHP
ncbi:MAG: poly-beta-1,6-N-acetyl-D-glucosamine synthase [Gammaproteobacteria bacterium]